MEGGEIPFVECIDRYCVKELPNTRFGEKGELMKKVTLTLSILLWFVSEVYAQEFDPNLPANFPSITTYVYDSNAIGDGYIFLTVSREIEGIGYYVMLLDNDGTAIWYKELPDDYSYDFKIQPCGLLSYAEYLSRHSYTGGGNVVHQLMDENFDIVESIQMKNGYVAEAHDFQLLPNGHALLFGYYLTQMDLSGLVDGGYPNALVSGATIQELDADRNVVFQWRTWDHYSPEEMSWSRAARPIVSQFHLNTINLDNDGHIFIATPAWVKKINRQTGEIMWHLGGDENEFTFIGVDPDEGIAHFGGHAFHRLDNGNVLQFDNGSSSVPSQVVEYALDEENMTAELVWSYKPDPPVYGRRRANAQRLPNGNTFIGWGSASDDGGPVCTEVTPDGEKVFELYFNHEGLSSYRAYRFPLPADVPCPGVTMMDVGIGDNIFRYKEIDTGVTIRINRYTGSGYNAMGVRRYPFAPLYPTFEGRAPLVLPLRVRVGASGITAINGRISFDAASFDLEEPNSLTVYHRDPDKAESFIALETSYNPATNQLQANMTEFGEFVIGKPDLEHIALSPILIAPESEGTVNEALPVALDWTPTGFVNSYHLQVATDPNFSALVVDESELKETPYIMETVEAGTTYYWRVSTSNYGGTSEWATRSFTTVAPTAEVIVPNGGEQWQRGLNYFIQWNDNLAEDVVIELYKSGTMLQIIDTVSGIGAYEWEVDLALETGDDYSVAVKSTVDDTIIDVSDAPFIIMDATEAEE
jgi:hypothetical protein